MNLFFGIPIEELWDAHVVKMVLETTQLLCACYHIRSPSLAESLAEDWLYRKTHLRHPVTVWVASSKAHFEFALTYAFDLAKEYTLRYGRTHKCVNVLRKIRETGWPDLQRGTNVPEVTTHTRIARKGLVEGVTWFPLAMPPEFHTDDAKESYKAYYKTKHLTMKKRPTNRRLDGPPRLCAKKRIVK